MKARPQPSRVTDESTNPFHLPADTPSPLPPSFVSPPMRLCARSESNPVFAFHFRLVVFCAWYIFLALSACTFNEKLCRETFLVAEVQTLWCYGVCLFAFCVSVYVFSHVYFRKCPKLYTFKSVCVFGSSPFQSLFFVRSSVCFLKCGRGVRAFRETLLTAITTEVGSFIFNCSLSTLTLHRVEIQIGETFMNELRNI